MTENSFIYSREEMPSTPGRRRVRKIEGDPGAISARAADIESLGDKMARAAATLERFADGTVGRGESFEAVREQAKEVYEDLQTAARRYRPSGTALAAYATALSSVQADSDWRVDGANRTWPEVNEASRALSGAEADQHEFDTQERLHPDVEQTGTRPSTAGAQAAFDAAVSSWEAYWGTYDAPVETWESAYDTAVNSLERTNADGVSDSFWDNSMPFVEGMLTVLMWVGVALLIVAFFVTGPLALLAGVLAAVAGVLTLLGEISRLAAGRGSWADVGLAALGVIPFGRLARLASLGDVAGLGNRILGGIRIAGDEFVEYGSDFTQFLNRKMPDLFSRFNDAGEMIYRSPHGLNSQNLMRLVNTPGYLLQNNSVTTDIAQGFLNLMGNPTTRGEFAGGLVDVYVTIADTIPDIPQMLGAQS
ncbi:MULTISPECIES: hypothetical protein [Microbacterium]|uniref:hypothetical protein n=1 Tax=Microbacterium TaxID=33882 RepID=UPI000DCAF111|nr:MULTISPECIES: hypothetical protein [Microbacterium]RAZ33040.1 hypothetical protein DO944_07605 [Microbacterium sp. SMR1]